MSNIRRFDMDTLDHIFEMTGGYVLNFSDRTFAQFFSELNIDICDPAYYKFGTSKAKRLRCFLQSVDKPTVVRTLKMRFGNIEKLFGRGSETRKKLQMRMGSFCKLPTESIRLRRAMTLAHQ